MRRKKMNGGNKDWEINTKSERERERGKKKMITLLIACIPLSMAVFVTIVFALRAHRCIPDTPTDKKWPSAAQRRGQGRDDGTKKRMKKKENKRCLPPPLPSFPPPPTPRDGDCTLPVEGRG